MNINIFWEKINLSKELLEEIENLEKNFAEVNSLCGLYEKDHKDFYKTILEKEKSELWFLYLYSFMACKTYDKYLERRIPDIIFWNTFMDIRFWCENYEREYGKKGLGAHDWFYRHIDLKLFRFGRLQFEEMYLEEDLIGKEITIPKGTKVLNIHIPQGEKLAWKDCRESISMAEKFWGKDEIYICHSWLLYPGLADLLGENSNIRRFAKHFTILSTDFKEREAEWRIFGKVERIISDYPEETLLQKRTKEYLLSGKVLGNSWGVLKV